MFGCSTSNFKLGRDRRPGGGSVRTRPPSFRYTIDDVLTSERYRRTRMSRTTLRRENLAFAGTGGVSKENRSGGFWPGFYDRRTGKIDIARFSDGRPAPCHLLDGIPEEWVAERDPSGRVNCLIESVVAGFVRQGQFYTREQAARLSI